MLFKPKKETLPITQPLTSQIKTMRMVSALKTEALTVTQLLLLTEIPAHSPALLMPLTAVQDILTVMPKL